MTKVKVSHTIDKELITWMDSEIADKRFASRSHAIEYAVNLLIKNHKEKTVKVTA
jgi:Arc/MetJ-type ribon-helix-helix transcriptional regulator